MYNSIFRTMFSFLLALLLALGAVSAVAEMPQENIWAEDVDEAVEEIGDMALMPSGIDEAPAAAVPAAAVMAVEDDFVIDDKALVKYNGAGGDVVIPDTVTFIGDYAFADCKDMTSVKIPRSVTGIGNHAFYNCDGLTEVTIPDSVVSIDDCAFMDCDGLTGIVVPASVDIMGVSVFKWCRAMTSAKLPDGLNSIADYTFDQCPSLTDVYIPNSVTRIGDWAFSSCTSLRDVTLPDSLVSIGRKAFVACPINATIPNSVTYIGLGAFSNTGLTSLTIPDSVTELAWGAFSECKSLASVTLSSSIDRINEYMYDGCIRLEDVTIPEGITRIDDYAFRSCAALTSITIPKSVNRIGFYTFENCSSLTDVTILNGDAEIVDPSAFSRVQATFHVPCDSKAAAWAVENGYNVARFDHVKVVKDAAVAPTETQTGLTEGSHCSVCGEVVVAQEVVPALEPTAAPTAKPTTEPTTKPTAEPTAEPTAAPTAKPTVAPTAEPTVAPTAEPTAAPTAEPTAAPKTEPTAAPTEAIKVKLSDCTATVKDQTYTGKVLKPAVTVKYGKTSLKKGTDYTVSYKNNTEVGTATVTVKGKGNYTGTEKITFKIVPKKVSGLTLKAGKKKLTASWKKVSGVTGYQLQYATKKDFSNAKKVTVKKANTVKTTLKKLKAKTAYYVRIRSYKTVKGKKYYSAWSKAVKARTK